MALYPGTKIKERESGSNLTTHKITMFLILELIKILSTLNSTWLIKKKDLTINGHQRKTRQLVITKIYLRMEIREPWILKKLRLIDQVIKWNYRVTQSVTHLDAINIYIQNQHL